jgi:hypothetical protein
MIFQDGQPFASGQAYFAEKEGQTHSFFPNDATLLGNPIVQAGHLLQEHFLSLINLWCQRGKCSGKRIVQCRQCLNLVTAYECICWRR